MPPTEPPRPVQHLTRIARQFPKFWRHYERFFELRDHRQLDAWPSWCYCPLAGAYAVVSGGGDLPLDQSHLIAEVGAVAAWRPTKGIYRFDRELARALIETPIEGDLPREVLHRLPEWGVWIETDSLVPGFFAHLEHDANDGREELRFAVDSGDKLMPVVLHLVDGGVEASLDAFLRESQAQWALDGGAPWTTPHLPPGFASQVKPLVSLLLYLCSDEPDYGDSKPPVHPARGHKTAQEPRIWDVGVRIGAALRGAQERQESAGEGAHLSPRPHVRRAHWHTFWVGPKSAPQKPVVRWLSPILVGAGETVATVRRVT